MGVLTEIAELAKAGFSKAEILQLVRANSGQQKIKPKPEPNPEPKPELKPEPKPELKPEPKPEEDILTQMKELLADIRNANIVNTNQPKETTVDDVIAQIINPTGQEGENK